MPLFISYLEVCLNITFAQSLHWFSKSILSLVYDSSRLRGAKYLRGVRNLEGRPQELKLMLTSEPSTNHDSNLRALHMYTLIATCVRNARVADTRASHVIIWTMGVRFVSDKMTCSKFFVVVMIIARIPDTMRTTKAHT